MLPDGDYVDLTLNPERFTGYVGPSSRRVWSAIYSENCFGLTHEVLNEPVPDITRAKGECLEQRVYYKIISGASLLNTTSHLLLTFVNRSTRQYLYAHLLRALRPETRNMGSQPSMFHLPYRLAS